MKAALLVTAVGPLLYFCASPQDRALLDSIAHAEHRRIHDERAYARDLDIDRECATCHEPAHLQLFREKHAERVSR